MNLDDELRDHIERETSSNIESGMTPQEARTAALRRFGNTLRAREETQAIWGWLWAERIWQDLSHGARMFAKNPAFIAIAVISISFGQARTWRFSAPPML